MPGTHQTAYRRPLVPSLVPLRSASTATTAHVPGVSALEVEPGRVSDTLVSQQGCRFAGCAPDVGQAQHPGVTQPLFHDDAAHDPGPGREVVTKGGEVCRTPRVSRSCQSRGWRETPRRAHAHPYASPARHTDALDTQLAELLDAHLLLGRRARGSSLMPVCASCPCPASRHRLKASGCFWRPAASAGCSLVRQQRQRDAVHGAGRRQGHLRRLCPRLAGLHACARGRLNDQLVVVNQVVQRLHHAFSPGRR